MKFSIKNFRSTLTNLCNEKDHGRLCDASRALGHKDTRTIEPYYAKINAGAAIDRLGQTFMEIRTKQRPLHFH